MGKIKKVFLFDVSALTPDGIKEFQKRVDIGTPLSDVKLDPQTLKISHIRAFFDTDVDIGTLVNGFNVKCTDITGIDHFNL